MKFTNLFVCERERLSDSSRVYPLSSSIIQLMFSRMGLVNVCVEPHTENERRERASTHTHAQRHRLWSDKFCTSKIVWTENLKQTKPNRTHNISVWNNHNSPGAHTCAHTIQSFSSSLAACVRWKSWVYVLRINSFCCALSIMRAKEPLLLWGFMCTLFLCLFSDAFFDQVTTTTPPLNNSMRLSHVNTGYMEVRTCAHVRFVEIRILFMFVL